jgi:arylsulfatase A-like enzyme
VKKCRLFLTTAPPEPFFCAAGLYKPHLPWHVPKRFFDLYDVERITLPVVRDDDLDDVPPVAKSWALSPKDHELVTSRGQWRHAVQGYLAAISYCDWIVGRIVDALDRSGLADDTVIVLWGDNGFHLGEKLHWRKFVLWEEATRVPMIIVPQRGVPARPACDEPVGLVDLFPTISELSTRCAWKTGATPATTMVERNCITIAQTRTNGITSRATSASRCKSKICVHG